MSDEPSWARVISTTLRLWFRRRVLRVHDGQRIGWARWTGLALVLILVVGAASAAVLVTERNARAEAAAAARRAAAARALAAAGRANAAAAAAWIASQVNRTTVIACDPTMCAVLTAAGFPASREAVLERGDGVSSSAALVVSTAFVRDRYPLAGIAPVVIASFGSGPAVVQVRQVASQGYLVSARRARAVRRADARALLATGRLHVRGTPRSDLLSGRVDPRLVAVLRRLTARFVVSVVRFANSGPQAGPSVLLRTVEIDGLAHGKVNEQRGVLKLLRALKPPDRASIQRLHAGGATVLKIEFPAPSPLG